MGTTFATKHLKSQFSKSKMADGAILKNKKSSYLRNESTDLGEIWQNDADLVSQAYQPLRI